MSIEHIDEPSLDPRLVAIFTEQFGEAVGEKLTYDSTMEDIEGWDSFTFIEFIMTIEDRFQVEFREEELTEMFEVGAIQRILRAHLKT